MKKICISFNNFTEMNFQKKGYSIYDSLNGNELFSNLAPPLPEVKITIEKYAADLAAANSNDRDAIARKNKSRGELDAILKQLGLSVMAEANGDVTMLISSGFTLAKEREPRYITNPGNVTLSNGITSGQMISMIKAIAGGMSYVHEISSVFPVDDTVWVTNTSSASKFVFTNLIPGKQYWVRVAVIGARKQKAYSNVATWFAQ